MVIRMVIRMVEVRWVEEGSFGAAGPAEGPTPASTQPDTGRVQSLSVEVATLPS